MIPLFFRLQEYKEFPVIFAVEDVSHGNTASIFDPDRIGEL
jgi:hypothetical protein